MALSRTHSAGRTGLLQRATFRWWLVQLSVQRIVDGHRELLRGDGLRAQHVTDRDRDGQARKAAAVGEPHWRDRLVRV